MVPSTSLLAKGRWPGSAMSSGGAITLPRFGSDGDRHRRSLQDFYANSTRALRDHPETACGPV